jgi:transcriptional regulator with XRE-family HTH domain
MSQPLLVANRGPRKGPSFPFTPEMRVHVRAFLDRERISESELARRVKITPALVNQLLNGRRNQSTSVPDICRATGYTMTLPSLPIAVADHAEKLARIYENDRELAESLIKTTDLLAAARKKR